MSDASKKWVVSVLVLTPKRIVVEASSAGSARMIAKEVSRVLAPDQTESNVISVTEGTADDRLSTYTCGFCAVVSAKEAWGPGRTTCPACGKRALTADEARAAGIPQ